MDFKALMAAQIAKSKPSTISATPSTKYQRRSEQEAKREAEYHAEQARIERERTERLDKKRKLEDEEAEEAAVREEKRRKLAEESRARREAEEAEQERLRRKRLGLPDLPDKSEDSDTTPLRDDRPDIPDDELQSKLRDLGQPVKLYAESHEARVKRFYKLTSTEVEKIIYTKGPIPTALEPVPASEFLLPTTIPQKDTPEYTLIHRQLASYFTLLLSEWNHALSSRSPSVQQSQSGIAALNTYHSVLRDLTPLYRKLESRSIPSDLLSPIIGIARDAQNRRYVDANDAYLRLSIGKAAWPIGVTMVGIHERSAREKIHEGDKQAHIMSDEVTRKMLQSIKRCLSFAQTRWPPEDIGQLMG